MSGAAQEFWNRGFLNVDKGMAAFEYRVEWYHENFAFANFAISDCNRVVNLNFDFTDEKDKLNKLAKLEKLIGQLQQFKEEVFSAN